MLWDKHLVLDLLKHGHQVKIGTSNPSKLNDWLKSAGTNASVGSFAEAARFGEIIVLAVKGTAALNVLEKAGSKNLANKTIIDTTNPIADAATGKWCSYNTLQIRMIL